MLLFVQAGLCMAAVPAAAGRRLHALHAVWDTQPARTHKLSPACTHNQPCPVPSSVQVLNYLAGGGLPPLLPAAAFVGGIGSLLYLGGTRTIDAINQVGAARALPRLHLCICLCCCRCVCSSALASAVAQPLPLSVQCSCVALTAAAAACHRPSSCPCITLTQLAPDCAAALPPPRSLVQGLTSVLLARFAVILCAGAGQSSLPHSLLHGVADWGALQPAVPIIFLSLVFHDLTPVIVSYLGGDRARIRCAQAHCRSCGVAVVPGWCPWHAVAQVVRCNVPC